ncbi:MAG: DUF2336 domain-containing protein [Pseudomonadota bacterium]
MAQAAAKQTPDGQPNGGLYSRNEAPNSLDSLLPGSENRTEAIVRAATDAFVAPRRRSPQEITVYAQLVRPLLPKVGRDTLRWVAAVLSSCDFAPSETCRTLANQSIPIAAPILATATKLSVNDQIAIAQTKSEEHRVLLAQRKDLSALVIEEIVSKGEAEPVRHLLRTKPKAMSDAQGRSALTIIAGAMSEEIEARAAATRLAKPDVANDTSIAAKPGKAQNDQPLKLSEDVAIRARQMADMRTELTSRTSALEQARNELLSLAQRARGHDVKTPRERHASKSAIQAASAAVATDMIEVPAQPSAKLGTAKSEAVKKPAFAQNTAEIPAPTGTSKIAPRDKTDKLADAASSLDRNNLQRALETTLGLSPVKVSRMMGEPGLEALCVALRAVECKAETAHKLLTAVHMCARRDMKIVQRLRVAYSNLDPVDCRKALDQWQREHPLAKRGTPTVAAPGMATSLPMAGLRGRVSETPHEDDDLFEPSVPAVNLS